MRTFAGRKVFSPTFTPPEKMYPHFICACGRKLYEVITSLTVNRQGHAALPVYCISHYLFVSFRLTVWAKASISSERGKQRISSSCFFSTWA